MVRAICLGGYAKLENFVLQCDQDTRGKNTQALNANIMLMSPMSTCQFCGESISIVEQLQKYEKKKNHGKNGHFKRFLFSKSTSWWFQPRKI